MKTHDDYIQAAPEAVQGRLRCVRALVRAAVPDAIECISYGMPAFRRKKIFFYYGAFKKHIGVYPPVHSEHPAAERTAQWRGPKGNLVFPHTEPLPEALLVEVIEALLAQYA